MEKVFDTIDTFTYFTNISTPTYVYVSLDTADGLCVGHWLWECALFLPYIKDLQKTLPYKLKILLHNTKRYKKNILSDFDFHDTDIVYSSKMVRDERGNGNPQEHHVIPEESEYILYLPKFLYMWETKIHNSLFFDCLDRFRDYYIRTIPEISKSIPITYVARSKKEYFDKNFREFVNKDEIVTMLVENKVNILDVDELNSLAPQFTRILKSKTIIVEMGSAFQINAGLFATNSHIIIINDLWGYHDSDAPFFHILRKLMNERNNTIEVFSTGAIKPFIVDKESLEKRVGELMAV
jgi:hypothetical protein